MVIRCFSGSLDKEEEKKQLICKNEVLSYMPVNSHGSEVMQWNHPHLDLVILLSKYFS